MHCVPRRCRGTSFVNEPLGSETRQEFRSLSDAAESLDDFRYSKVFFQPKAQGNTDLAERSNAEKCLSYRLPAPEPFANPEKVRRDWDD